MKGNSYSKGAVRNSDYLQKLRLRTKGKNNPMYGKKLSQETRFKIGQASRGKTQNKDWVKKRTSKLKKKIEQLNHNHDVVNIFGSLGEASEMTGVNMSCISSCCHGRRKSSGDYLWRYAS